MDGCEKLNAQVNAETHELNLEEVVVEQELELESRSQLGSSGANCSRSRSCGTTIPANDYLDY